jgi:hypothetical protein
MKNEYIPIDRLQRLQKSIKYLDTYLIPENKIHHIGPNINTINVKETKLLNELGKINKRRENIISELMSIK